MIAIKKNIIKDIYNVINDIIEWPEYIIFEPLIVKKYRSLQQPDSLTTKELNNMYVIITNLKKKCEFSILFKSFIINIININTHIYDTYLIDKDKLKQNIINDDFLEKYEYFISWLWDIIKALNIWPLIKFIFSIISVILLSKK